MTTTVLYLNEFGLDIRCIQLVPYVVDGQKLLAAQTVIPIPNAGDYMVKLGTKAQTADKAKVQKAQSMGDVVPFLVEQGVLTPGTRVHMIKAPSRSDYSPVVASEEQKGAIYEDKIYFRWCGERTSLAGICKTLFKQAHGVEKPFPGPSHFALEGQTKNLGQLAREMAAGMQSDVQNRESSA